MIVQRVSLVGCVVAGALVIGPAVEYDSWILALVLVVLLVVVVVNGWALLSGQR